jgi:hypothetical protein
MRSEDIGFEIRLIDIARTKEKKTEFSLPPS